MYVLRQGNDNSLCSVKILPPDPPLILIRDNEPHKFNNILGFIKEIAFYVDVSIFNAHV